MFATQKSATRCVLLHSPRFPSCILFSNHLKHQFHPQYIFTMSDIICGLALSLFLSMGMLCIIAIASGEQPAKPATTVPKAVRSDSGYGINKIEDNRNNLIEGMQIRSPDVNLGREEV
jgi:hypothetical protein